MESSQAMADGSVTMATIQETIKMVNEMAKELMSIVMAQPMRVLGKTACSMVWANTPINKAQSKKETGIIIIFMENE